MMKLLTRITTLLVTCVFLAMGVPASQGHSWYPMECCHNQDCAPIVKEQDNKVTTEHGTVEVPQNFRPVRPSQDEKSHACIINNKLICIFRPAGA